MATPTLRTTYALDLPTAQGLERLAQLWATSKSEVIRRMTREALARLDAQPSPVTTPEPVPVNAAAAARLAALDELSRRLHARGVDFDAWKQQVQDMRR